MAFDMMRPINLVTPPEITFGPSAIGAVAKHAADKGYTRPLIVADAFNASRADRLGLPGAVLFGEVQPEPDSANLDRLLAMAEDTRPDLIIGFGGGSAMDLAKLAAGLLGSGQRLAEVVGAGLLTGRRCGLVQVPTTAGTGSEAGIRALVTNPTTQAKLAVESRWMLADLAVVDPELALTVPPLVTAATGVDAMAHCVEAFTSRKAHPAIDMYAQEGIRLVGRYLARAVANGNDLEARTGLALASLYGGYCLGPVNTTAGHAVAYPLGTRYHVPHGAANALIFPHVLAFNAPVATKKTALILGHLGLAAAPTQAQVLEAAHGYCSRLGLKMRLSEHGVEETDTDTMADEAFTIRRLLDNNPRDISRDEIAAIYRAAF